MPDPRQSQAVLSLCQPGQNCWRVERAGRAAVVVDAADYFRLARQAMLKARSQILVMGWDLDTRIELITKEEDGKAPVHLGALLQWLARRNPELRIQILAWGGQSWRYLGRGTTMLRLARWRFASSRIDFRLDTNHPRKASHHQKILVIDDAFAFCGGIDMTGSRWDTREHRDKEPGRRRPTTHRRYGPWHDAAMAVDGAAARALGDLGRNRWRIACDAELACPAGGGDPWPEGLEPQFRDVTVAVARTRGKTDEREELREIEALFLAMVAAARRFVYVESQYFASRKIAEAICKRLGEPDGPEFVVVNPKSADGWLEEQVMGAARAELLRAVRNSDRHGRFRIFTPVTEGGEDIYVHAKIMIVDDRLLRVGSANLNNRSMGLDSECDLLIDADAPANRGAGREIARMRCDLLAEHLGVEPDTVANAFEETGSLIATVERLRAPGRSLAPFAPPEFGEAAKGAAKSEIADPETAEQPFEPMARHRLLRGLRR